MTIEAIRHKLASAQSNMERFQKLAGNPRLSRGAAIAAHSLARSYMAAVMLYRRALAYEIGKADAGKSAVNVTGSRQQLPYKSSPPLLP